jgi:hypothetical protein
MGLVHVTYGVACKIARPLGLEAKIEELAIRVGSRKRTARIPNAPYRIWVEPTNACNLRCVMCDRQAAD